MKFIVNVGDNPLKDLCIKLIEPKDIFVEDNSSKIFTQREGSDIIMVKPYLSYMLAAQAKASYSRYIIEADKDCKFHHEEMVEIPDPKALEEYIFKNKKCKAEYDLEYREQRAKHIDWFKNQSSVENIAQYVSPFIKSSSIYKPKDILSIIDSYKYANAYLKEIGKSDELPRIDKKVISPEFKKEWKAICSTIKEKTGYKTEAELKKEVLAAGYISLNKKTRLKLDRKPGVNIHELIPFSESFMEFIFENEISN